MNMAITMNGLKGLAGRMTEKVTGKKGSEHTTLIMQTVRKIADTEPGKAPLIGHLPVDKQYLYAGGTLIVSLLLAAGFTIYSLVQLDNRTSYETKSGDLKVLSQRLPLTAQQSVLGNAEAFKKLAEGKATFETTLAGLNLMATAMSPPQVVSHVTRWGKSVSNGKKSIHRSLRFCRSKRTW